MNIKVAAFTVSEKSSNTTVTVKLITYLTETKRARFCLNAFKFGCVHLAHTLMCHFSLFYVYTYQLTSDSSFRELYIQFVTIWFLLNANTLLFKVLFDCYFVRNIDLYSFCYLFLFCNFYIGYVRLILSVCYVHVVHLQLYLGYQFRNKTYL